jgi:hypothetical protein
MKYQALTPTVEHGEEADFRSEMLGVGGNDFQCFCRRPEEDAIDNLFVLVGNRGNLLRNSEHDMIIGAVE